MSGHWERGDYTISTDKRRLDLSVIHDFLDSSYWAAGRSVETIRRSIEHSLPFGIYKGDQQVGFARVITDYATFAWIADVFVLEAHRGQGLSKWLMDVMISHPESSTALMRLFIRSSRRVLSYPKHRTIFNMQSSLPQNIKFRFCRVVPAQVLLGRPLVIP